jgi:hypothetical protein
MANSSKTVTKLTNQYLNTYTAAANMNATFNSQYVQPGAVTVSPTSTTTWTSSQPAITWGSGASTVSTPYYTVPYTVTLNPSYTTTNILPSVGAPSFVNVPAVQSGMSYYNTSPRLQTLMFNKLLGKYGLDQTNPRKDWKDLLALLSEEIQGYYYFQKLITKTKQEPTININNNYINMNQWGTQTKESLEEDLLVECMVGDITIKALNGSNQRIRAILNKKTQSGVGIKLAVQLFETLFREIADELMISETITPNYYVEIIPFIVKPLSIIYSDL